jgi:dihydroorotate dehydrogenase
MLMVGATAVGVGSAVRYGGAGALGRIARELKAFMEQEGYTKLEHMRGRALR